MFWKEILSKALGGGPPPADKAPDIGGSATNWAGVAILAVGVVAVLSILYFLSRK